MPKAIVFEAGETYGRLTVQAIVRTKRGRAVRCLCICGKTADVDPGRLKHGLVVSCNCRRKEALEELARKAFIHGMHKSPEHRVWRDMIGRCSNPKCPAWVNYGGRGIKVCEDWRRDFRVFFRDMGPRPSDKHSLDRFPDNNGNYEAGNCRWAIKRQQERNRRDNIHVNYLGEDRLLVDVCEDLGLNYQTVMDRRHAGWPDWKLFLPIDMKRREIARATQK